jgi:hypothetical protein
LSCDQARGCELDAERRNGRETRDAVEVHEQRRPDREFVVGVGEEDCA